MTWKSRNHELSKSLDMEFGKDFGKKLDLVDEIVISLNNRIEQYQE